MAKLYRVNFEIKKCGYRHYGIDIEADSSKDAKIHAEWLWRSQHHDAHLFHLRTRVIKKNENFERHDDFTTVSMIEGMSMKDLLYYKDYWLKVNQNEYKKRGNTQRCEDAWFRYCDYSNEINKRNGEHIFCD